MGVTGVQTCALPIWGQSGRAAGTTRGNDALAAVAGSWCHPRHSRDAARLAGARRHRSSVTVTLATAPHPELDPLLLSGVIAVVRVSEPVRLGPAARALAAGGSGAPVVATPALDSGAARARFLWRPPRKARA